MHLSEIDKLYLSDMLIRILLLPLLLPTAASSVGGGGVGPPTQVHAEDIHWKRLSIIKPQIII